MPRTGNVEDRIDQESTLAVGSFPKVELHVHLEATPRLTTLRRLADEAGREIPEKLNPDSDGSHEFESLPEFIKALAGINPLFSTPQIYGLVLYEYLQNLAEQSVVYAEIRYSPARPVLDRGMDLGELMAELGQSMERGEVDFGIKSGLILSLSRNRGADVCTRLVEEAVAMADGNLAGFDLSDDERKWPAHLFQSTFELIDKSGFPATVHAGETVGPKSVWDAIDLPGTRRIGHGLSVYRDSELLDRLSRDGIHLELCPTSNVRTNQINRLEDHPIRTYVEAGLSVSVNSDDPIAFGTDVSKEYALLTDVYGFGMDDIENITMNAAEAAFASDDVRQDLRRQIADGYEAIRNTELQGAAAAP